MFDFLSFVIAENMTLNVTIISEDNIFSCLLKQSRNNVKTLQKMMDYARISGHRSKMS